MRKMHKKFNRKRITQWSMSWLKTRFSNVKLNKTQVVVSVMNNAICSSTNWNYLNITTSDYWCLQMYHLIKFSSFVSIVRCACYVSTVRIGIVLIKCFNKSIWFGNTFDGNSDDSRIAVVLIRMCYFIE